MTKLACFAQADAGIFDSFKRASKMPAHTPGEQKARGVAMSALLVNATESPLSAAESIANVLGHCYSATVYCHSDLESDFGAGCMIMEAAAHGLLLLVEGNVRTLDEKLKIEFRARASQIAENLKANLQQIMKQLQTV